MVAVSARVRAGAALLGPAFVAAIAYVDPGNVATNTAAGAKYGYLLVWVLVVANVMAGLVQYLSAKLGLVTGQSLPEAVRDHLPRPARLAYWGQAEVVAMATDPVTAMVRTDCERILKASALALFIELFSGRTKGEIPRFSGPTVSPTDRGVNESSYPSSRARNSHRRGPARAIRPRENQLPQRQTSMV